MAGPVTRGVRRLRRAVSRLKRGLEVRFSRGFPVRDGTVLPPGWLRHMSADFRDDGFYLDSCDREGERLARVLGVGRDTELLEIGCSSGRLVIGLLWRVGEVRRYVGIDLMRDNVAWCRRFLAAGRPAFRFIRWNMRHARYNPRGRGLGREARLPLADGSFDLVYLHSVAACLLADDLRWYLGEFRRLLREGGRVFLTAFVEEDVPPVTVNPESYVRACIGPLNIVRYERGFLFGLVESSGLKVERYEHGTEYDRQSAFYLRRPGSTPAGAPAGAASSTSLRA